MQQDLTESAAPAAPQRRYSFAAIFRTRGAWALADQAVVSLGNCLTGILLAKHLLPDEFGIFALVFGAVLFLNSLHQSLVTYPLSVRGAVADGENLRKRVGSSLLFTSILTLPLSIGLVIVAGVEHRLSLIPWALLAMFLWQFQETLRRGIMAHLRHHEAVLGDAISYLGQAVLLFWLAARQQLTLETAFASIAITSLLAALLQAWQLRPVVATGAHLPETAREHWSLGRWVLMTNLITLVTVQAVPWTLAYFHGNVDVARFAVLAQVMGPSNPIIISLSGLIVPAVAVTAASRGLGGALKLVGGYAVMAALLLTPYYGTVALFPKFALHVFTGGNSAYADLTTPLRLFVLAYVIIFPGQMLRFLLDGLGRTRCSFIAQCAFSASTLLVSIPLAAKFSLVGAVWGGLVPAAIYVIVSAMMVRKSPAGLPSEADRDPRPVVPINPVPALEGAVA